ncbi:MAG: sigma-70 family RNA polymerase sigma factor [Sarcina sp.]
MQNIISLPWHRKRHKEKTEIDLAKDAIKGNKESYIELVKVNKDYLYKIAYSYVKNKEKALDIISETTYRGIANINKLKKPEFFKTWITRILINIAVNEIKKEEKYVYTEEDSPLIVDEKKANVCEKLDLYEAMDKLKDKYKTAIMLRYFNDMSIEEVASVMELPINTVKSHLRRGKEALKVYLGEGYNNEY